MKQHLRTLFLRTAVIAAAYSTTSHGAIITYSSGNSAFTEFTIVTNVDTGSGLTALAAGSTIRIGTIANTFDLLADADDYQALQSAFNEFELLNAVGDITLDEIPDTDGGGSPIEGAFRTGQNEIDGFDPTQGGSVVPYDTNGDLSGDPVLFMLIADTPVNPTQYALVTSVNWAFPGDASGSESLTMSIHDELEAGNLQVFHGTSQTGVGSDPNILTLEAVPEPTSSLLLGLASLFLFQRRRR